MLPRSILPVVLSSPARSAYVEQLEGLKERSHSSARSELNAESELTHPKQQQKIPLPVLCDPHISSVGFVALSRNSGTRVREGRHQTLAGCCRNGAMMTWLGLAVLALSAVSAV